MRILLTCIAFFTIVLTSCKKDPENPTAPKRTLEELLTERSWKADEIKTQLSNNTSTYYKRGETKNTVDYGSYLLKFNANNN